jgi:hypothetical protein
MAGIAKLGLRETEMEGEGRSKQCPSSPNSEGEEKVAKLEVIVDDLVGRQAPMSCTMKNCPSGSVKMQQWWRCS